MKDTKKILNSVKYIINERDAWLTNKKYTELNRNQFELKMQTEEEDLFNECPTIFKQCMEGSMDLDKLNYMFGMMKKVHKNESTYEQASRDVGQRFAEEYLNPLVEKLDKEKGIKN